MFAAKCASYLQQGISVVLMGAVTGRTANLQAELFELLGIVAEVLTVGSELPTLPLWIDVEQCIPLELEQTFRVACSNSRIAV